MKFKLLAVNYHHDKISVKLEIDDHRLDYDIIFVGNFYDFLKVAYVPPIDLNDKKKIEDSVAQNFIMNITKADPEVFVPSTLCKYVYFIKMLERSPDKTIILED